MERHYFLMQVDKNGRFLFDFQFYLFDAVKQLKILRGDCNFEFCYYFEDKLTSESLYLNTVRCKNEIPVGSVEFVSQYLKEVHNKEVKPINIPNELMSHEFLKRYAKYLKGGDVIPKDKFVKVADRFKQQVYISKEEEIAKENVLVSDVIDINSEWRIFISNQEIRGIKQYSGSFFASPPSYDFIKSCIEAYKSQPKVYTLDIGKNNEGEFVIEVHDFFSCSTYGFNSLSLPTMFSQWFYEFIRK